MNKLNPIKYIENMISHHPKSISLWITEGIVINDERYIIKEFRLRDGSLYAVIAENKYTPKYFEVKLAPDEETLKDIYQAIEENKLAIEKEVTDRKNEIARVDTAIKANTTKIEQEIADRKSEIARVDKAIEANTAKIDKEISDRESEIERVDQAIEANTEKINQEITDRQNEITRVDNAINANTAKIDKEIQDRKNEITRVDGAINANTEKINQEITDRTNEINRVDGKLTDLEGKLTTSDGKIAELDKATKDNKAKIDQEIIDRKREIDRVDEATKANKATIDQEIANRRDEINRVDQAIEANTAKINKEISDRKNEITRVDGAINANTAKINKEITDRTNEITRVESKIPTEIGTVNLFKGSRDFSGSNWIGGAGVYAEDYKGVKIFKKQDIWGGRSQYFEVKAGEEYVFSAYVKSSAETDAVNFYLSHDSKQPMATGLVAFGSDNRQDSVNIGLTNEYKRIAIKIKITKDGWIAPRIERYNSDAYLFFGGYKLERGNVATDWSPSPEDKMSTNLDALNLMTGTRDWSTKTNPWHMGENWSIENDEYQGLKVHSTQNGYNGSHQNIFVKNGDVITFSFFAKATNTLSKIKVSSRWADSSVYQGPLAGVKESDEQITITSEWKRYSKTIHITSNGSLQFRTEYDGGTIPNGNTFYVAGLKLAKSELDTGYSENPIDVASDISAISSEFKQTTDSIKASVQSLDNNAVKSSSLNINTDGVVIKAGKSTSDFANAVGSYFSVNQNAVNKFSDRINVKTAMIADGAVTSAKIAREITLDMLTCGKIKNTNEITVFDLNTGTLKFSNNSGRIQRAYRDKVIEITDYITSTSGAQDYATSAFVVRKSDNSKQAAVKLTLDNTKAEATITSDLFYISDSKSKMLFSVDRTNNVKPDWGDIPIAHVLGGLVANDISIGGRSKSLLKIVDELCKKSGITWS